MPQSHQATNNTGPGWNAPQLSVAPMMGYTDMYLRYLLRYLSPNCWLYTEMICTPVLVRPGAASRLQHHKSEHPLVLQMGGGDPNELRKAAIVAVEHGYQHLNLNAGCPSNKVRGAGIGACLYKEPHRLRECAHALRVPGVKTVSVKTRLGVDELDSYQQCHDLAAGLLKDGCDFLALHARKAWLNGLNPSQNRSIPPLNYEWVYRLQADLPQLPIILNGGLATWQDCSVALERCAGVMLGRAIIQSPAQLMELEYRLWGTSPRSLPDIFEEYFSYLRQGAACRRGWNRPIRHLMALVRQTPGASKIRHQIAQAATLDECERICKQYAHTHYQSESAGTNGTAQLGAI